MLKRPLVADVKQKSCFFICLCCVCVFAIIWMSSQPQKSGPDRIFPTPSCDPQPESRQPRVSFDHTHTDTYIDRTPCLTSTFCRQTSQCVKTNVVPASLGNVPRTIWNPLFLTPANSLQIVAMDIYIRLLCRSAQPFILWVTAKLNKKCNSIICPTCFLLSKELAETNMEPTLY